jgi:hypothetical protein
MIMQEKRKLKKILCGYLDAMRVRPKMVALSMRVLLVSKVPCKKINNNNFSVHKKYIQQKVN